MPKGYLNKEGTYIVRIGVPTLQDKSSTKGRRILVFPLTVVSPGRQFGRTSVLTLDLDQSMGIFRLHQLVKAARLYRSTSVSGGKFNSEEFTGRKVKMEFKKELWGDYYHLKVTRISRVLSKRDKISLKKHPNRKRQWV